MKQVLLIIIGCISTLTAQVNPPDLRCLEVLASGNVKLTWIPPADPGGEFFSYDVYFSVSKNGPFAIVSSGINAITTTTFTHVTATGTIQNCYYFMVTKYGAGGAFSSKNSDTIKTIYLTSFPNLTNGTQDFQYNQIHVPKLSSTGAAFTLNKEYPLGTWNILTISSNTVYPDTINVCKAQMNYQATLPDESGCFSVSNLLRGEFVNSKNPEQPYVDSISVLPNGYTVIAWKIPFDKDINRYNIQYRAGSTNIFIDSVMGRQLTSYTYTVPTANLNSVGLFVQAQDSCTLFPRTSTVNYQLRTMFLGTTYDGCAYRTTLKWNKYVWADVKGVQLETTGKYRIYYSVNGSGFTLAGETTDTSFVHSNVEPGKNICYFVRVVNQKETITASSNRSCFFSDQVNAPTFIYLKTATVMGKNSVGVRVFLDNSKNSKGIVVQRSENEADFADVGFIPFTGEKDYSFIDERITPHSKNYSYKALVVDSCGNRRGASNSARTILLKVQEHEAQIFTKQLSWTEYKGFAGGTSGYNIYRIVNDDLNAALIGSTDALKTSFTDNIENAAAQGAKIEYVVQAVEGIGNPYGILENSNSNPVSVYMEGTVFVPNAFAPTGVNRTWMPITSFIEKTDYHVRVFDRWGKKVFEAADDVSSWNGEDCIAGVYVYLIDYKNARGEYLELKGTVTLMR